MAPASSNPWYLPYLLTVVGFLTSTLFLITGWLGKFHVQRISSLEEQQKIILKTCATRDDVGEVHRRLDELTKLLLTGQGKQ